MRNDAHKENKIKPSGPTFSHTSIVAGENEANDPSLLANTNKRAFRAAVNARACNGPLR